ncbi:MAG: type IV secretion system protein [Rickettsiaceae bacterium]|nr:type IV secretion system protein [Rickettsiaceae bacterium]
MLLCFFHASVIAAEEDEDDWRNTSIDSLNKDFANCISLPEVIDTNTTTTVLDLSKDEQWIATGVHVTKDKLLEAKWNLSNITPRPKKYRVLYRIDPRFKDPQVFIKKYNPDDSTYHSWFHDYNSGDLLRYQVNEQLDFLNRIKLFSEYFADKEATTIPISKGDIVNITIDTQGKYWSNSSDMTGELGLTVSGNPLSIIYTQSPIDNNIIYSNTQRWCEAFSDAPSNYCSQEGSVYKYNDSYADWRTFEGMMDSSRIPNNISSCAQYANGLDNALCYYDKSRGLAIKIDGTTIKSTEEQFINSSPDGKSFFYYTSNINGNLSFTTDWDIANMYSNNYNESLLLKNWGGFGSDYADFSAAMNVQKDKFNMNHLYFGRYFLEVEVGNTFNPVSSGDLDAIQVEYMVLKSGESCSAQTESGTSIDKSYRSNAPESGYLCLRVLNPSPDIGGTIKVTTENYTGSTWFSDVIYGDLVQPLRSKFNDLTYIMYIGLVNNTTLRNIAYTMLSLYISIYGLMFLVGSVQITVTDIVTRVIKIAIIFALFSQTSWDFFNLYLFNVFVEGTDSLMTFVIGNTSRAGNVFGFIDTVFNKYTNSDIWFLLLIQFLQFYNGLTFFAIMTIYSLILYFKSLLEVIVGYCVAFLGLAVMISIAPLFIILILFERTKSIFDNWISTLFSYMIQPTLLLVFFLLIDQIISTQISHAVVESCWGSLIDISVAVDLKWLKLPMDLSFKIPGLNNIPFYIPNMSEVNASGGVSTGSGFNDALGAQGTLMKVATSSFTLFVLCKLIEGAVQYVELLTSVLTNVQAARQAGDLKSGSSAAQSITSDITTAASPITSRLAPITNRIGRAALSPASTAYNTGKFITNGVNSINVSENPQEDESKEIDYSKVNTAEKSKGPEGKGK